MQKLHKAIIIGASLSGKTTLIRYLRQHTDLPVLEIDEEVLRLNNNSWPTDDEYKKNVLTPKIIHELEGRNDVVFFTNSDYFDEKTLVQLKKAGFRIIQLSLSLKELRRRNLQRVKEENYQDMSPWLEGMVKYQRNIESRGLVDITLPADQPTETLAKDLVPHLTNN